MKINIQLPTELKADFNLDLLRKAIKSFCIKCNNYTEILKVNDNGSIIVSAFSNELMLEPVIMLMLLCRQYPQVFSFQFQESNQSIPKFKVGKQYDNSNWNIEYPLQRGVCSFSVNAIDADEALIKANEEYKSRQELPQIGFWIRKGQQERAIQILSECSFKIDTNE